ncbi:MAG: hypothetical protein SFV54_11670 [Bryobacteraceae bacterium]|nr:hypothetical protein [Bryobacteraceae bacterium]
MRGYLAMLLLLLAGGAEAYGQGDLVRVQSPLGFSLEHPRGWRVMAKDASNIRVVSLSGSRMVVVQAVPVGNGDAMQALRQYVESGRLGAGAKVLKATASAGGARASIRIAGAPGSARAHALLGVRGGMGTVMAAVAPEAEFFEALPGLVAILRSFAFREGGRAEAPASAAAPAVTYTRVRDAAQNAFSIEAPAGWQTQAGLFQPAVGDTRPEIVTSAPGGEMTILLGDRNVNRFLAPNQTMMSLGVREGSPYNSGIGVSTVMRYLPGQVFAEWMVNNRFRGARVTARRERPDVAQTLAGRLYKYGNPMNATMHAGEVEFEYQGKAGYYLAATEMNQQADMVFWNAHMMVALLGAGKAQVATAGAIAKHMLGSVRWNLQWVMETRRMTEQAAREVLASLEYSARLAQQTLEFRQETADRQARVRGDLLTGNVRLRDPNTGEEFTARNTSNYYYRPNDFRVNDRVIGNNRPLERGEGIDVTELRVIE